MFETTKDKRCNTHTYIHKGIINIPLLASSEDVKPVEVIKSERNCPNPRPIKVFLVQNCLELIIFSQHRFSKAKTQQGIDIYFSRKTKTQFRKQQNTQKPICRSPICECVWSFWGPEFWVFVVVVVVLESKHKGLQWNWNESEWKRGFILDAKVNKQRWKFPNSKWECLQPSNFLECCQWLRKPFLFSFFFGLNFCFLLFILFPFTFTSFFFW